MGFGQLLRHYRRAAGFSQEHLADLARLSVESIGSLERGARRAPYRETVALLAQALRLDAEDRAKLEAAAANARARPPRNAPDEQSADALRRLPIQTTSLVGREHHVADIIGRLQTSRLVTITGSGGVGKTRIAIEVATRMIAEFRTDVRFIDLSQLSDGSLIVDSAAAALTIATNGTTTIADIARSLASTAVLLVIDNCEHLIAEVALLVSTFLRTCPKVVMLATSRERLAVQGEVVYRLPSLELPAEPPPSLESARRYDAIELFVQRAATNDHAVAFTDSDVDDVSDICRRLDGIPLALELAAARVGALGLAALRSRLREGLALVGTFRNLPVRQQTIRATIAWSYDLLAPDERRVLQRVSLFAGGFTLSAAESVCAARGIAADAVADILSSLVEKSLANVSRSATRPRFTLLDAVRSFALERLQEAGDLAIFSDRHAEWMAAFADWVDTSRAALPDYRLRAEVDPELDNARTALAWALGKHSEAGAILAGRIVGGLRTIWLTSGRRPECRRWASAALDYLDDDAHPTIVAPLLRALVQMADGRELVALAERAMSVFERIGDRLGMALLQSHVSNMNRRRGFIEQAEAAIERASAIFAEDDLPRLMPYTAFLHNRLELRLEQGRYEEARADIEEGIAILHALGDDDAVTFEALWAQLDFTIGDTDAAISRLERAIDRALKHASPYARIIQEMRACLSIYLVFAGRIDAAYQVGRQAIQMTKNVGDESRVIALHAIALIAALRGQAPRAARLLGAIDARLAAPFDGELVAGHAYRRSRALLIERLANAIAPDEFGRLTAEGRSMTIDMALAEASGV